MLGVGRLYGAVRGLSRYTVYVHDLFYLHNACVFNFLVESRNSHFDETLTYQPVCKSNNVLNSFDLLSGSFILH